MLKVLVQPDRRSLSKVVAMLASLAGATHASDYHLEVTGQDRADAGLTVASAWRTFDFALPRLQAGDTLWIGPGEWSVQDGGLPFACCDAGVTQQGQPGAPISIRATQRYASHLVSDGTFNGVAIVGCSSWKVEGLWVSVADNPGGSGGTGLLVSHCDGVELSRNLVVGQNRARNTHSIEVFGGARNTVEENEVYDFSGGGIVTWEVPGTKVHRNYVASRSRTDGVFQTTFAARGDVAFSVIGTDVVLENNISEGNGEGFLAYSYGVTDAIAYFGNISLDDYFGIITSHDPTGLPPINTLVVDHLALRPQLAGAYFRSSTNTHCIRCSALDALGSGFSADRLGGDLYNLSAYYAFSLARGLDAGTGLRINNQNDFSIADTAITGFPLQLDLGGASTSGVLSVAPAPGPCFVYTAEDAGLYSADGGRIGATVLQVLADGGATAEPLWDPGTGAFRFCGPTVPGVNDDPATSCSGVHLRLHVGSGGCPLPASALDAGTTDAGGLDAATPDAGLPDAGVADGGLNDAEPGDAGAQDAGESGAGVQPRRLSVGCGCQQSSAPASGVLLLAFLGLGRAAGMRSRRLALGRRGFH